MEATQNKMGTAKMLPLIISMSLPAMFSMLVQALYNVVDSYFVSQVSENALTAVSRCCLLLSQWERVLASIL